MCQESGGIVKNIALIRLPMGNQIEKNGFFIKKSAERSVLGFYYQNNELCSHIFIYF